MISYCIPVCNEHRELKLLLTQLTKYLGEGDEILIQGDQGNVSNEVVSVISPLLKGGTINYVEYPLNGDFAKFKNNMLKYAKNPWIFQIDADELISDFLLENIHYVVGENPHIEAFAIPRVNIVKGLTKEWSDRWGWRVMKTRILSNDDVSINALKKHNITTTNIEFINYPDYQVRLFQNNGEIFWMNKVHEVLTKNGVSPQTAPLPANNEIGVTTFDYALFHIKDIDRQVRQNDMYDKIKP